MVRIVDCKGMPCPLPIITLRRAMAECEPGAELEVRLDSELSAHNVQRYLADHGVYLSLTQADGLYSGRFANPSALATEELPACATVLPEGGLNLSPTSSIGPEAPRASLVIIDADTLGRGCDELGGLLIKGLLSTLTEWDTPPTHVVLMNGGVRLAVGQSGTVETLRQLEHAGTAVWLCGTCVDHFGLAGELGVGQVRNMYDISRAISAAPRVIRL
ncbi:MAG: sulfurtransferase-like selenium metabolism protein YedF [Bacteroidia bacterium]|nr:MAG: sulfurtransferase-like selenium metabolism protein YedF [Bacteroidia bacterium]